MRNIQKIITAVIIILVAAAAGISALLYFSGLNEEPKPESETQTVSLSQTQQQSATVSEAETENTQCETESAAQPDTTEEVTGYELPLTVREAMDVLQLHYGKDYEINSTIEEDGFHYFAVNYNGEKIASVAVDLNTGRAVETMTETGAKTEFSLV